jgi:hypothetical protein
VLWQRFFRPHVPRTLGVRRYWSPTPSSRPVPNGCRLLADIPDFDQGDVWMRRCRISFKESLGVRRRSGNYSCGHIRRASGNEESGGCRTFDGNHCFKRNPALRPLFFRSSCLFCNDFCCLVVLHSGCISGRSRGWPKHEIAVFHAKEVRRRNVGSWPFAAIYESAYLPPNFPRMRTVNERRIAVCPIAAIRLSTSAVETARVKADPRPTAQAYRTLGQGAGWFA